MVDLEDIARQLRRRVVQLSHQAKASHLSSCLSSADIIAALYGQTLNINALLPNWEDRDRFVLSKAHAAMLLYAALAYRGFISEEDLATFGTDGSKLTEHPPVGLRGVEAACGSLGHGAAASVGAALAARLQGKDYRVFCLLGDGECGEGSVWEAAMIAAEHRLRNLCFIIDANGIGGTDDCSGRVGDLRAKFAAFGWYSKGTNGHDPELLARQLDMTGSYMQPLALVCRTVKGFGVSFMAQDGLLWHYRSPNKDEFELALAELE